MLYLTIEVRVLRGRSAGCELAAETSDTALVLFPLTRHQFVPDSHQSYTVNSFRRNIDASSSVFVWRPPADSAALLRTYKQL